MTGDLKEGSDFRNERDDVPAGIRASPNPQIFLFFEKRGTLQRRDAEVVGRVFS